MTKWERINQPKKVKPPRYYSVELGRHQRKRKIKKVAHSK